MDNFEININEEEEEDLLEIMKLNETAFSEWDNEEDEVYNEI